ncbi:MAG: indolepyruvate oxidoreductase subunit beta [Desulfitobacteriaceae bacterium]
MDKLNIMIVGVGGQGTLLASRILGAIAFKMNYDVKVSEVHGMSQRGGSVVTYIKYGTKIHSPLIEKGEADIILAFEKLEALRWTDYLKDDGMIIINDQEINPMPVIIGKAKYPAEIVKTISQRYKNVFALDALKIAIECGNLKAVNIVLLGVMAAKTAIDKQIWDEAIKETVPEKLLKVNVEAFDAGYKAI